MRGVSPNKNSRPWTEEDDAILLARYPTEGPRSSLAVALRRSTGAVRQRARILGLTRPCALADSEWTIESRGIRPDSHLEKLREPMNEEAARSRARQLALHLAQGPRAVWQLKKDWTEDALIRFYKDWPHWFGLSDGVISLTDEGFATLLPGRPKPPPLMAPDALEVWIREQGVRSDGGQSKYRDRRNRGKK